MQSALTGYLVLSTLHTNDAGSSITRLLDMGVEDYLLTSTLSGILAQRLVRTLCNACKRIYTPLPELMAEVSLKSADGKPATLCKATGCGACAGTGYLGRTVIREFLVMSEPIRRLVLSRADSVAIQQAAIAEGMTTMKADGIAKAMTKLTTLEEVLRVTQES